MKKIMKGKLNNSRGASIIIAMVFMLICVFVGGSVLTAATMNAYRIEHLSDAQEFLDQRSAALLVAEDLRNSGSVASSGTRNELLRMDVYESSEMNQNITIHESGAITNDGTAPTPSHKLRFSITAGEMTAFKRTFFESAILNYLTENSIDLASTTVEIENFNYNGNPVQLNNFWLKEPKGSFKVQGTAMDLSDHSTKDIAAFDAEFKCAKDYHYTVNFGALSQMEVSLRAAAPGVRKIPAVTEILPRPGVADRTKGVKKVSTTQITVITWKQPRIEKGMS